MSPAEQHQLLILERFRQAIRDRMTERQMMAGHIATTPSRYAHEASVRCHELSWALQELEWLETQYELEWLRKLHKEGGSR